MIPRTTLQDSQLQQQRKQQDVTYNNTTSVHAHYSHFQAASTAIAQAQVTSKVHGGVS
jgi:hypothetical protein